MKGSSIELFIPQLTEDFPVEGLHKFAECESIKSICLMCNATPPSGLPSKVNVLRVETFLSTAVFKQMAATASAEYVVYFSKGLPLVEVADIEKFCETLPSTASMGYADYHKIVDGEKFEAPAIDYQQGSLRNDFDFGSVLLFRTAALKSYLAGQPEEYVYAGLYQLRLALSRAGELYHYKEILYAEPEEDRRKSGEKQFDYVNPAQRDVQVEMECVCTHHLKAIGAFLPACKYDGIDLSQGTFPVEASVIIPVLNRASTIADAIASVLEQQTSFPFNVIVVDNHSTDGTSGIIDKFGDGRVVHLVPERCDLGIGGCWNEAVNNPLCGRFAVQLDSDDLYSSPDTLQHIVDEFYNQQCAMLVGTYRICDFELNTLPPGIIDHREWTEENGRNNALRINGLGAPRAFYTPVIREVGFPNVSYGEDYAVGLQISRRYRIGRIYDVLYLCRRWGGNSDAALSHAKVNAHNAYKDSLRTAEVIARKQLVEHMETPSKRSIDIFFEQQLAAWSEARDRYRALNGVEVRNLENGITLQYNPARAVSTGAKVDAVTVASRPCFLCAANRPVEQCSLPAMGTLEVLVNPFPILPFHLTIPSEAHKPQLIKNLLADMLHLAKIWPDVALFYNGAKCGASAPDHAHLQAVRVGDIPLLGEPWSEAVENCLQPLYVQPEGAIYKADEYIVPLFKVVAGSVSVAVGLLKRLFEALPLVDGEGEPRMNVVSHYLQGEGFVTYVIPRGEHRPSSYGSGEGERLVSPGTLDMCALVITPRECDFREITAEEALAILKEVGLDGSAFDAVCEKIALGL
ncbi:MAG: DUF4922 domain-containing protein [Bacteroidaceae bacterium]|nr:DUF4922 domain-containing protein [Bacteroidaceae bacterium]